MSSKFTEQSLQSFRVQASLERRIIDEASEDLAILTEIGALDSFVETFSEGYDELFGLLTQRLIQGGRRFSKQVEESTDPLEYTDNNGCAWLFDPRKPHLGWV